MSEGLGFFDEEDAKAWWDYIEEHLKEKKEGQEAERIEEKKNA